ncbi:5673_t:CDS:2 [Entrophospora sp. SA101]|nr:7289_t:CDS:2 [Entrophospora sp. SA101]CAJ0851183.1 5673_t:CDS:2 [Entrophospora sp. SA101]CAJ0924294.1 21516_t:CDS:2 [Entrophospora sp. SA101]
MNFSLTERLIELNNALEKSLISDDEFKMIRASSTSTTDTNVAAAASSSFSISTTTLQPINTNQNSRSIVNDISSDSLNQPVPEFPPPPYTPPESSQTRYRRPSTNFFIKPKTSQELRKEIQKLREDRKKEQETWKAEERRLKIKVGAKPEDIDRVKRKLNESTEKYNKKIEIVQQKLNKLLDQQTTNGNGNGNSGSSSNSGRDNVRRFTISS